MKLLFVNMMPASTGSGHKMNFYVWVTNTETKCFLKAFNCHDFDLFEKGTEIV